MDHISDIYWMYQTLQDGTLFLENKQSFLAKNSNEKGVNGLVDKFWNDIRHRVKAPQNDIDWWIKKPFEDFKFFVNTFEFKNKSNKRQEQLIQQATESGAELLGEESGFEIWYAPNYDSACILGRNYKNRPTHWCITSDDPEWWFDKYAESEFILLIRKQPKNDEYDKVAIQFEDGGRYFNVDKITVWDLNDNDNYDPSIIPDDLLRFCWELFKDSGLSKESF